MIFKEEPPHIEPGGPPMAEVRAIVQLISWTLVARKLIKAVENTIITWLMADDNGDEEES